jgi:hypothetical protein
MAKPRLIIKQSMAGAALRLKSRHRPLTSGKKSARARNSRDSSRVSQSVAAVCEAKTELPTIYTFDEFVLIMLHQTRARTIWNSVTSRERVGRIMMTGAPTKGEKR